MHSSIRALVILNTIFGVAATPACSNHAHLLSAKPLAAGQTRVSFGAGGYVRVGDTGGGMYTTDLAMQRGVTEWLSLGVRVGLPHGLSVNGVFNLFSGESLALSVAPMLNVNWWYMDERFNHVRAELPLLLGVLFGHGHEMTFAAGYGVQAYFAGGSKVTPATGQYVTGQLSARLALNERDRVGVMPYVAYTHFVAGKRLGGSQKVTFGIAFTIQ